MKTDNRMWSETIGYSASLHIGGVEAGRWEKAAHKSEPPFLINTL